MICLLHNVLWLTGNVACPHWLTLQLHWYFGMKGALSHEGITIVTLPGSMTLQRYYVPPTCLNYAMPRVTPVANMSEWGQGGNKSVIGSDLSNCLRNKILRQVFILIICLSGLSNVAIMGVFGQEASKAMIWSHLPTLESCCQVVWIMICPNWLLFQVCGYLGRERKNGDLIRPFKLPKTLHSVAKLSYFYTSRRVV